VAAPTLEKKRKMKHGMLSIQNMKQPFGSEVHRSMITDTINSGNCLFSFARKDAKNQASLFIVSDYQFNCGDFFVLVDF
jgi:hypothetical protein